MVYGVDQCRMCGTAILPKGPDAAIEQEKANRRPLMPEKEWRRRGFLTSPTRYQLKVVPADGCCAKCGLIATRKHLRVNWIAAAVVLTSIIIAIFVVRVVAFLPH